MTELKTMAGKALLAFSLSFFSWLFVVYGRDLIQGGREILTIKRAEARVLKEEMMKCDRSVSDFVLQETVNGLDSSTLFLTVHRNGEVDPCGSSTAMTLKSLDAALQSFKGKTCPTPQRQKSLDKYMVESLLTEFFANAFADQKQCASTDTKKNKNLSGFRGFCDMGHDRTVPQPDSVHLVEGSMGNLPCRFFTREGVRISSMEQLVQLAQNSAEKAQESCQQEEDAENPTCVSNLNDMESSNDPSFHLYAVPAGRVFMFAPKYVGEIFELPHVLDQNGHALSLEVLSVNPRVFDIHHFFSEYEAQQLIDKALNEQSETHKLHRSTTGTTGSNVYNRRTSENAWDTHGSTALTIKKRCLAALGFDEYYESHTDGLQILRYNLTTAYIPHMDYLTDVPREKYDFRSEGRGGNRFATILLYMSDLEESWGGETVFSKGTPKNANGKDLLLNSEEVRTQLREKGEISMLAPGSWEEKMTIQCRTQLSVTPKKSRAVLFYSQFPNGTADPMSEHGGCPVLQGTKWAANLWVWNAARNEYEHAPFKFGQEDRKVTSEGSFTSISALFFNSGQDERFNGARLFWHDQYFGELGAGESVRVNTYVSHVWNVKDRQGNILHTWTINHATSEEQHFSV